MTATGFSHSNSDTSLESLPSRECAIPLRRSQTGETACIIDAPHVFPINSMVIGKSEPSASDRQTLGIGRDGDPAPTLQTQHHHAVATCIAHQNHQHQTSSSSMTLAYDGWNQTATPETVQTLRTCNGTDGDDRTPKICTSSTPPQNHPTHPPRGMTLTYVSLFSGIEAFSVAASRIADVDWRPVFFSEIDPFPCAVLAHRFPSVPNLGDVCKIRVEERTNPATNTTEKVITNGTATIPFPRMGVDILAGGSPCQDVSVAGLRRGMQRDSGTRSSLAFEYARLVEELRPRIILWENVPGVLSSRNGLDFRAFLGSLVERGYCCAWRVLDAQFTRTQSFPHAVPQRRRRVWLVGCLGADESVPAQILSLAEGLRGDPPPRRETGKGSSSPAGYRADRDDRVVEGAGRTGTIGGGGEMTSAKSSPPEDSRASEPATETSAAPSSRTDAASASTNSAEGGGSSPTLFAGMSHQWGSRTEFVKTGVVQSASFDGHDVSATLHKPNGSPGFSDQEIFSQGGAYLARQEMRS